MNKQKDMNVGIPPQFIVKLDEFLNSDECKELGITSRRQLIIMILREWMQNKESSKYREDNTFVITDKSLNEKIEEVLRKHGKI